MSVTTIRIGSEIIPPTTPCFLLSSVTTIRIGRGAAIFSIVYIMLRR